MALLTASIRLIRIILEVRREAMETRELLSRQYPGLAHSE